MARGGGETRGWRGNPALWPSSPTKLSCEGGGKVCSAPLTRNADLPMVRFRKAGCTVSAGRWIACFSAWLLANSHGARRVALAALQIGALQDGACARSSLRDAHAR